MPMSNILAVVPSFNSANLIIERIEELRRSSFNRIVVCDDRSDDDTIGLLKSEYGNLVEVIAGEDNLGPGGNRNRISALVL